MSFSLVQLLLAERDIPAEVRQAIVEHRLRDAAELLMTSVISSTFPLARKKDKEM
jgi:hypothetical protein